MSKKVVVDSSVIIKWISSEGEERLEQALALLNDARKKNFEFYAPILAKYECGNAIWKKKIDLPKLKLLLEILCSMPINFIDTDERLSKSALEIAVENEITFYDASFISLAVDLGAILVTDNPKHQKQKLKSKVKVVALGDY